MRAFDRCAVCRCPRFVHVFSFQRFYETSPLDDLIDGVERIRQAVELAEGALLGTERKRALWDDSDYLVAILATLTGDGDRARRAAMAGYARRPVE